METRSAEVIANIAICLIHQTNYLIDQQVRRLEQDFLKKAACGADDPRADGVQEWEAGRQGSNEGNAGRQGGGSPGGRSSPEAHSPPDSRSYQPQKPPGHQNPPRPGGQS